MIHLEHSQKDRFVAGKIVKIRNFRKMDARQFEQKITEKTESKSPVSSVGTCGLALFAVRFEVARATLVLHNSQPGHEFRSVFIKRWIEKAFPHHADNHLDLLVFFG